MEFPFFAVVINLIFFLGSALILYFLVSKVLKLNHELSHLKQQGENLGVKEKQDKYNMLIAAGLIVTALGVAGLIKLIKIIFIL